MKLTNNTLLHFTFFFTTLLFVFRDLITNFNKNLIDLRDYPLMVWIMSQHVFKIQNLNFVNYFDTNTFFPHKYALLFSDLLLPQAIISLPFYLFSNNPILIFNLVFILVFILNFTGAYLFWKSLFKDNLIAFFGSLFIVYSPFVHLSLDHFQMLNFWPFFFSLYFLFSANGRLLHFFLSGLFLSIQFLASVYLGVFLIFSIFVYLTSKLLFLKNLRGTLTAGTIILLAFLFLDGLFIKAYIDVKNYYQINRRIEEYIIYSAHATDYLFTSKIPSLVHQSDLMRKWNQSDKSFSMGKASSAGFLLTMLALFSILTLTCKPGIIIIGLKLDKSRIFFIILLLAGLIFSLGPRLNFNGKYAHIPLPYILITKVGPFEAVRSPARWSFIFYLGMSYFALMTIKKLEKGRFYKYSAILILLFFAIEYMPLKITTERVGSLESEYYTLKKTCAQNKKTLLEIPITHIEATDDVASGLAYINRIQLASMFHQCNLVNGYSGYDLPDNVELASTIDQYILNQQTREFLGLLTERNIDIVKFNLEYFNKDLKLPTTEFFDRLINNKGGYKIIGNLIYLQ